MPKDEKMVPKDEKMVPNGVRIMTRRRYEMAEAGMHRWSFCRKIASGRLLGYTRRDRYRTIQLHCSMFLEHIFDFGTEDHNSAPMTRI